MWYLVFTLEKIFSHSQHNPKISVSPFLHFFIDAANNEADNIKKITTDAINFIFFYFFKSSFYVYIFKAKYWLKWKKCEKLIRNKQNTNIGKKYWYLFTCAKKILLFIATTKMQILLTNINAYLRAWKKFIYCE